MSVRVGLMTMKYKIFSVSLTQYLNILGECAQALATANSSSRNGLLLQQINFSKASIILIGVILYNLLIQK